VIIKGEGVRGGRVGVNIIEVSVWNGRYRGEKGGVGSNDMGHGEGLGHEKE
jgi:hypothetical protein